MSDDARSMPESDDPKVLNARIRELEAKLRRAEMERDILKKATAYFAEPPPDRFAWIHEHREEFQVNVMCDILDVTRGGYYRLARPAAVRVGRAPRRTGRADPHGARRLAGAVRLAAGHGRTERSRASPSARTRSPG